MKQKITIDGLQCLCCLRADSQQLAYVLYPMDVLDDWIEPASAKLGISIAVITGMDWDNVFSPWPSVGEPPGSPDFKGESQAFLERLQTRVLPAIEKMPGMKPGLTRSLVGVSMSGLFALWQWLVCDTFVNIASLSGSFWYPDFIDWFKKQDLGAKKGEAYFLLGTQEPHSPVKAFRPVGVNTQEIVAALRRAGVKTEYQSVPGNHFSDPIGRLNLALSTLYPI